MRHSHPLPTAILVAFVFASLGATAAWADFSISNKATRNVSCADGVCTATAKGANLNVNDLTDMLAAGDTTVKTGGGAIAIRVNSGFSWTSTHRLTLDAITSVDVHKPIVVAGQGAVTIAYNDGGSGGDLKFLDKGKLHFWDLDSRLVINGTDYMLVNDIPSLAIAVDGRYSALALSDDIDAAQYGTFHRPPITKTFDGVFEGLGHTIKHLTISNTKGNCVRKSVGLFRRALFKSHLRDINILDARLTVVADIACNVGILIGADYGQIENVRATGIVTVSGGEDGYTGGIAGYVRGIRDSSSAGSVSSSGPYDNAGGLVGYGLAIKRAHSSSDVHGDGFGANAGGLVGTGRSLIDTYATGDVTGGLTGGLVGSAGLIDSSFATGTVTGDYVGGLASLLADDGTISNSYALGAVNGGLYAGGIFATSNSEPLTTTTYSVGAVSGQDSRFAGGFAGYILADSGESFSNDDWDTDTSGMAVACGSSSRGCASIEGLTDAELKSGLPAGFDPKIWGQSPDINGGYPYLLSNPPPK